MPLSATSKKRCARALPVLGQQRPFHPVRSEAPPLQGRARREPWFSWRRLFACTIREQLELLRDPIRIGFAIFGTTFLMLVFGFGISTDVNSLTFAVLDHDHSHESRAYLEELRGSSYFVEKPPLTSYADLEKRLADGSIAAAVEIPPGLWPRHRPRPPGLGGRLD